MNNLKSCVPCVCTGSGRKQVCEEHDIGAQCGSTATNTATETVENINAINIQQNQQKTVKSAKSRRIVKIGSRRNFDILSILNSESKKVIF